MENLRHSRETVTPYESDTEFMNTIDASLWWYLYRRLCGLCSSSSNSLLIEDVEKGSKRGLVEEVRKDGDGWQGKGAAKAEHAVFSRYAKNDTNLRARTNLCFLLSLSLSLSLSPSLSVCLFHDSQSRVSSRVNRQASKCRTRFQVLVQKSAPCQSIPVWTFAFYAYQWFTALCIIRSLLAILQMGHLIRWISPVNRKQVNILK